MSKYSRLEEHSCGLPALRDTLHRESHREGSTGAASTSARAGDRRGGGDAPSTWVVAARDLAGLKKYSRKYS